MNIKDEIRFCIICGSNYIPKVAEVVQCPKCSLLYSGQKAGFGNPIHGMAAIAFRNYATVSKALEGFLSLRGTKILDVGSAEGGFTELMMRKGADCLGLEPDRDAAKEAFTKNLPVKLVSFENFLGAQNEYDAIIFNDVFEHMQDPILTLEKSTGLLKDNGFIVINAPLSSGFIFRVAQITARLGIESPYQRIWAKGLCSPHIYFYSESNLRILLAKYKFEFVGGGRLVSLAANGMYQRVRSTYGPLPAFVISTIASFFILMSSLFPADVKYFIFRKR